MTAARTTATPPRLGHAPDHPTAHPGRRPVNGAHPRSVRPPTAGHDAQSPDDPPRPGYHAYGTFDDDHLVARLATRGYHSWFGGSAVPSGGIAGVVVTAERRGTSCSTNCSG